MSGDRLAIFLGFIAVATGAMIGAIPTPGWRGRLLWGIAVVFAALSAAYWRYAVTREVLSGFILIWSLSPVVGALIALLIVGGREPRKPTVRPLAKPPTLNPGLTTDYLNEIVRNATDLEAKRKLAAHRDQLAKLRGQVTAIREYEHDITVEVAGLVPSTRPAMKGNSRWSFARIRRTP